MWISIETWVCGNKSYPQLGNGKQKGVYVYNGILFNSRKKQNNDSCPNMEDTKTVWQMKVVTCKKLHIIWFQLYDISKNKQKKQVYRNRKQTTSACMRLEVGVGIDYIQPQGNSGRDGNAKKKLDYTSGCTTL